MGFICGVWGRIPMRLCWCIMDISGFLMVYIPFEVGVMVAWQGAGGIGMGSGIRICSAFFCTGVVDICTGGRFGWNMGFLSVTILASCLGSSAAAFLAFFLAFLDLPAGGAAGGGGSGTMIGFGGSVDISKEIILGWLPGFPGPNTEKPDTLVFLFFKEITVRLSPWRGTPKA